MFKTDATKLKAKYSTSDILLGAKVATIGTVTLSLAGTTLWIGSKFVQSLRTGDIDLGEASLFGGIAFGMATAFAAQLLIENLKSAKRE